MTDVAKKVLKAALQLKPAERQWLADEQRDRLDTGPVTQGELDELTRSPEYLAMLEQRLAEHDANPEAAVPAEQALAELRVELGRR